jgi:transcriptional regulator with XRE-family HTH domain
MSAFFAALGVVLSLPPGRPSAGVTAVRGNASTPRAPPGAFYRGPVDNRAEVRDFLTSRRARITPEAAGLPTYGEQRRVPGLRRTEVAQLAGMSIEYYTRLERGNLAGVSEPVLDSLARALSLDEAEREHLFDLARAASTSARTPRRTGSRAVRPSIYRILDALATPAYLRNRRFDILAANQQCFALYQGVIAPESLPLNLARFMFLDRRAEEVYLDWDAVADDTVAALRIEAGRNPLDRKLSDLVGELATRSDAFRTRWARHNVRHHRSTAKQIHNPVVGDLTLTGDALELPGEDLILITYTAPADSPAQEQLGFLTSWAATRFHEVARGEESASSLADS